MCREERLSGNGKRRKMIKSPFLLSFMGLQVVALIQKGNAVQYRKLGQESLLGFGTDFGPSQVSKVSGKMPFSV